MMYSRVLNACQENTLSKLIQISNRSYIATKSALTEKVKRELDRIERDCVVICINLRDLNTAILSEDFSFKSIGRNCRNSPFGALADSSRCCQ